MGSDGSSSISCQQSTTQATGHCQHTVRKQAIQHTSRLGTRTALAKGQFTLPQFFLTMLKREQIILALGDAVIFIFFAVQGRATHEIPLGPNPVLTVLIVAAPFAVPWFILAGLMSVYRAETMVHAGRTLFWTFIAWLSAGSIGLVARSLILQRPMLPMFAAAVLGINAALLLGWHLAVCIGVNRVSKREKNG